MFALNYDPLKTDMYIKIQLLWSCSFLYTMASQIVVGYLPDNSEDVDVEIECSSCCSFVGGAESRFQSLSSYSSLPL
jgi:hypothetical protein